MIGIYNKNSILAQVRRVLPLAIIQAAQAKTNILEDVLEALTARFSNESDVYAMANELIQVKFTSEGNIARQISSFLDRVNAYNSRCLVAKRPGNRWIDSRAFEIAVQKVHAVEEDLAKIVLQNIDTDDFGGEYSINVCKL